MISRIKTKSEKRLSKKKKRKFGVSGRGVFVLRIIKLTKNKKRASIQK